MTAKQQAIIGAVNALSEALRELCREERVPANGIIVTGDLFGSHASIIAPKRVRRPKTAADAPVPVAGYVRRKAGK